jgi:hypothetical protein
MAIKSSPAPLAISEIVTEFGDDAGGTDSLSEYYRGGANVNDVTTNSNIPTTGVIDIGDFYGTGNAIVANASAGTNVDIAPAFASPDTWTNSIAKLFVIASPIQIVGNNVALTVPSNMAGTLDIQNAGNIIGIRGTAGAAGSGGAGGAGGAAGAAISIQKAGVSINNSGTISGGGGGGGGGAAAAPGTSTTNFSSTNYTGSPTSGRGWNQGWGPGGGAQSPNGFYDDVVYGPAGGPNTTSLSQTSPPGTGTMSRGNPLGDPGPPPAHTKRYNIASGSYTTATAGAAGGAGGTGYGFDGSNVVAATSGASGASPGGGDGGDGGAAGAAGSAGDTTSPGFSGGAAGAAGNAVTSPGAVNYTVSNTGTINGTQG